MTSTTGENTASEPCRQKPGGDEGEGYTGDYYGEDADNWYCMFADVAGHAQADSPSTAGAAYFCMSEFTGPHTNEHSTYTQHSHFWDDYGQGVCREQAVVIFACGNGNPMQIKLAVIMGGIFTERGEP